MAAVHELLVLALVDEHPTHGYDIQQFLGSSYLAHCTSISKPHLYATLRNLEQRGLVEAREERQGNTPPRTVYAITERGREALVALLEDESMVGQRVLFDFDTVLSAMSHIQGIDPETPVAVIRHRLAVVARQLDDCQRAWDLSAGSEGVTELKRAICHHRRGYLLAEQRWLNEMESTIVDKGWDWFTRPQSEGQP